MTRPSIVETGAGVRRSRSLYSGSPATLPVALGLPVALWQAVFFLAPLVFLVVITFWQVRSFRLEPAFVLDNWVKILWSTPFHRALVYTLEVAATTTVLALLLAFPLAYTITFRLSERLRDLVVALLVVPVFSSYVLRIYAWQVVLGANGVANSVLDAIGLPRLALLGGAFSLQVGLLTLTLPIAVLILVFALGGVDRTLIEAAENLGCRRHQVVTRVLIPAVRSALVLAATTTFLLAFGDYVGPLFMTGSKPPTLSILVVDTVKSGSQWPRASVVGVSMLAVLATVFVLGRLLASRRLRRRAS